MNIPGFKIIEDNSVPKDKAFFIPKIEGLCVHGKENEYQTIYRDLTENEQRMFAVINL